MPGMMLQFHLRRGRVWATTVSLSAWRGFQCQKTHDTQTRSEGPDCTIEVVFAPEGRGSEPLTSLEVASVEWAIRSQEKISAALIAAVFREYPSLQQQFNFTVEERSERMPDLRSPEDLKALIGLRAMNVHQVQKDGIPYLGFVFDCSWDEEHGLGILMHGTRAVQIGGADTAILLWIAEEDGGTPLQEESLKAPLD